MPACLHRVHVCRGFVLRLYKELIGCRGGMCALCARGGSLRPRLCTTRARVVVTCLVTSCGKMVGIAAELRSAQSSEHSPPASTQTRQHASVRSMFSDKTGSGVKGVSAGNR